MGQTDLSKCSLSYLKTEREAAQMRLDREKKYIARLDAIIEAKEMVGATVSTESFAPSMTGAST